MTGNITRAFYDLMKFEVMHKNDRIDSAVLIVPTSGAGACPWRKRGEKAERRRNPRCGGRDLPGRGDQFEHCREHGQTQPSHATAHRSGGPAWTAMLRTIRADPRRTGRS